MSILAGSALVQLTHDWRQALDIKKDVVVVAIDLSKAFDSFCLNFYWQNWKLTAFTIRP